MDTKYEDAEICKKFIEFPFVDPRTNQVIKQNSLEFKNLRDECVSVYGPEIVETIKHNLLTYSGTPNPKMPIEEVCRRLLAFPLVNPRTGKAIQPNGAIYNKLAEECRKAGLEILQPVENPPPLNPQTPPENVISEICEKWFRNPNINPKTNRRISESGEAYKSLLIECGPPPVGMRAQSPPKTVKKFKCGTLEECCDLWKKNPELNPFTNRKITKGGQIYKTLQNNCSKHLSPESRFKERTKLCSTRKECCDKWLANNLIDPETGEVIVEGSEQFNSWSRICSPAREIQFTPCGTAEECCEKWKRDPYKDPRTGLYIALNSEEYKNYVKECGEINTVFKEPEEKFDLSLRECICIDEKTGEKCTRVRKNKLFCSRHMKYCARTFEFEEKEQPVVEEKTRETSGFEIILPEPVIDDGRCQCMTLKNTRCAKKHAPNSRFCHMHQACKKIFMFSEEDLIKISPFICIYKKDGLRCSEKRIFKTFFCKKHIGKDEFGIPLNQVPDVVEQVSKEREISVYREPESQDDICRTFKNNFLKHPLTRRDFLSPDDGEYKQFVEKCNGHPEMCKTFFENPLINPITSQFIAENGSVYKKLVKFCDPYIEVSENKEFDCISSSRLQPRPHQLKAIEWMNDHRGLILFHALGSGKTLIAAISAMCFLQRNPASRVIFVSPLSLTENFLQTFDNLYSRDDMRIKTYSYESFKNVDPIICRNNFLICDEAHRIRNNNSTSDAVVRAALEASKVLLMTATPIVNAKTDLINLLMAVKGEMIDKQVFSRIEITSPRFDEYLKNAFSFYQISEEDKQYFPRVKYNIIPYVMTDDVYNQYRYEEVEGQGRSNFWVSLRTFFVRLEDSIRVKLAIDAVLKTLEENGKIIIFSNFNSKGIKKLGEFLTEREIQFVQVSGDLTPSQRQEAIYAYNTGRVPILLITKAGGEGLDLKETTRIFIMDLPWNDASLQQAIGRGVRYLSHYHLPLDQQEVEVIIPIATKPRDETLIGGTLSVDEYFWDIIVKKQDISDALTSKIKKISIETIKTDNNLE